MARVPMEPKRHKRQHLCTTFFGHRFPPATNHRRRMGSHVVAGWQAAILLAPRLRFETDVLVGRYPNRAELRVRKARAPVYIAGHDRKGTENGCFFPG